MAENSIGKIKSTEDPVVSVVMPCHNSGKTLRAAMESALAQDVNLELIVVDDVSKDGTGQILDDYREDPRVRVLHNERRLGAGGSRNRGVDAARGAFIAFLDADDLWAEGKLSLQLATLRRTGHVLCCTSRELMTPSGELTGRVISVKEHIRYRDLLQHNCINCSSVLIRTEAAKEFPMEHEDSHEDYITWLKLLQKYRDADGIKQPLLYYRMSSTGKSGRKLKSARMTYRVYRYMGFGPLRTAVCFCSYALHGVWKYLTA